MPNLLMTNAIALIMGLLEVEPAKRMTIPQIFSHAWMMSPSQLAHQGSVALAERLTKNLRESGALDIAAPP
jgi:serine/threonine-protein kinase Chk1